MAVCRKMRAKRINLTRSTWYAKRMSQSENMTTGPCITSRQIFWVILAWNLSLTSSLLGSSSSRMRPEKGSSGWLDIKYLSIRINYQCFILFLYQPSSSLVPINFLDFMVVLQLDNDSIPISSTLPDLPHALLLNSAQKQFYSFYFAYLVLIWLPWILDYTYHLFF